MKAKGTEERGERQIPFQIVNAFGNRWRAGNAIGLIRERLDERMMQLIAMELNCALTVFPQKTSPHSYSGQTIGSSTLP